MTTENVPEIQKQKVDIAIQHDLSAIEQVVMQGDLSKLNPMQRVTYYNKVCESLGLNPYTKPFAYISLNGQLQLYARKDATEQLRSVKNISIDGLDGRVVEDLYIVKAKASMPNGRKDESTGAVTIGNLRGDAKANAIMKAETKAKRRVTLSIGGLGFLDETEIETIPSAMKVKVNHETGEIDDKNDVPCLNAENKNSLLPLNQENKHDFTENNQNQPEVPQENNQNDRISFGEVSDIMKGYVLTCDQFKENYEKYMKTQWNCTEFEHLPKKAYGPTMVAIARNIEKNKQQRMVG